MHAKNVCMPSILRRYSCRRQNISMHGKSPESMRVTYMKHAMHVLVMELWNLASQPSPENTNTTKNYFSDGHFSIIDRPCINLEGMKTRSLVPRLHHACKERVWGRCRHFLGLTHYHDRTCSNTNLCK